MNSKKIILAICICLYSCLMCSQEKLDYGIVGGANYLSTWYSGDLESPEERGYSYLIGVTFAYKLNKKLSLKTELYYEKENAYLDFPVSFPIEFLEGRVLTKQNNLMLPVLLKYNFNDTSKSFFITGGTYLEYLFRTKSEYRSGNYSEGDVSNRTNFNYGIAVGVGKEIPLNDKNTLVLEVRDNFDLKSVFNEPSFDNTRFRKNKINIIVSWIFNL